MKKGTKIPKVKILASFPKARPSTRLLEKEKTIKAMATLIMLDTKQTSSWRIGIQELKENIIMSKKENGRDRRAGIAKRETI